MKKFMLLVLLFCAVFLVSCDKESTITADNGNKYTNVPEEIKETVRSTSIVHLVIRPIQEQITAQYQAQEATGSGGMYGNYGYYSMQGQIIEGKGILLVEIIDGPEEYQGIAILKFVDLKAMALRPGYSAHVSCVVDYEMLNPATNETEYTPEALTYELDDCRLDTPMITVEQ